MSSFSDSQHAGWQPAFRLLLFRKGDLFHLEEAQFVRRRAAKDRNRDLENGLVLVDLLDLTGKAGERARLDADDLADLIGKLRFRLLGRDLDVMDDLVDLGLA